MFWLSWQMILGNSASKKKKKILLVETSIDKEFAALKEEVHRLKKAGALQVQKCEVCYDTSHNSLSCPSKFETVHSMGGIPNQALYIPPPNPLVSAPSPMEDMMKLLMQTTINLNESLTK